MKFQNIRTRAELALGEHFDQRSFHDFVMAQGMLPLDLLAQVVMEEFVPEHFGEN